MSIKALRQQSEKIHFLQNYLHNHMALFGYEYISLPLIEPADIFLTRAGDTIIDRLFTFDRFGQQLALRPEFTAAAAHLFVTGEQDNVVRWQFNGAIFEDAPDDHALDYQKYSIGAECIGLNGIETDAETIAMAVQGIAELGIMDWKLVIGHVGLQLHLLSRYGLDSKTHRMLLAQREFLKSGEHGRTIATQNMMHILTPDDTSSEVVANYEDNNQTQHMLDVLLDSTRYGTTMGGRTRHDIAQRLLNKRERSHEQKQIRAALDFFSDWVNLRAPMNAAFSQIAAWLGDDAEGQALLKEWEQTINLLGNYGIREDQIIIQADLTKNWEYYTGLVFGVEAGDDNYIVGGGRYDELTRVLGSENNVPAIGFAYYVDAMLPLIASQDEQRIRVILKGDANIADLIGWATFLRNNEIAVVTNSSENGTLITIENGRACLNEIEYPFSEKDNLLKDLKASIL